MTMDWPGIASDAWERWKRDRHLLLPLAGLFLFLPQFAFYLLVEPFPRLTPEQAADTAALLASGSPLVVWITHNAPGMLATVLAMTFGSLVILSLYLDPAAGTPGRALARAPLLFPRYLLAAIVTGLPAGPIEMMMVVLILPCLYLLGRIVLVAPIIVAERPIGVARALARSFALTRHRGLAMMALAAMVTVAGMLGPAPFRLLRDAFQMQGAAGPAIALMEGLGSAAAAIVALATLLVEIALYRRLAGSISGT